MIWVAGESKSMKMASDWPLVYVTTWTSEMKRISRVCANKEKEEKKLKREIELSKISVPPTLLAN